GFWSTERVADDHVGAWLTDRFEQFVEGNGLRRECLRDRWRVASTGAEAFIGTHAGGLRDGGFDCSPAVAAAAESGDEHHRRRAGTVTVNVKSSTVHRHEFVDDA